MNQTLIILKIQVVSTLYWMIVGLDTTRWNMPETVAKQTDNLLRSRQT